jgi:hypothetical protein
MTVKNHPDRGVQAMTNIQYVHERVFARGFILTQLSTATLQQRITGKPFSENLSRWTKTFFGPCSFWVDPRLNYGTTRDNRYGVGVMGLCINPFDGLSDNQSISNALFEALTISKEKFLDYVDQLSGAFVIMYRENADVFLLQDTAATKPVYYHRTADGILTATSHISLLHQIDGLALNPLADQVFSDDAYRKDPSRYMPGLITSYQGAIPLTANHALSVATGRSIRFFPREALEMRPFDDRVVNDVADIMVTQARMIAALRRPMVLAATGGRDSRVSAAIFSGLSGVTYFSFHMPSIGHLSDDVDVAKQLASIEKKRLRVYELERYGNREFMAAFQVHSPHPIWPNAALCYIQEFDPDAIHIRSTVSEIGRIFYGKRNARTVSPEGLARTFTGTDFSKNPSVIGAMKDFIDHTDFDSARFFNYDLHDMFYWEHRNSKWQNILCSEAEMATDVFIPFNNRNLLKMFMSIPYLNRQRADIHLAVCDKLKPEFKSVKIV